MADWNSSFNTHSNTTLKNASIQLTKAFRSVGLVRGSGTSVCADAEYVLVLDNYALGKGDANTVYSWRAILADDLSAANATFSGTDCVLSDTLPATDLEYNRVANASGARLLARQLRVQSQPLWPHVTSRIARNQRNRDRGKPGCSSATSPGSSPVPNFNCFLISVQYVF